MIEGYFDGACEPVNPGGTASYGAIVMEDGKPIFQASDVFKPDPRRPLATSNNVAEYSGFEAILNFLINTGKNKIPIIIRGDSKLVIEQMQGKWKIKQGFYVPIALRCRDLLHGFAKVELEWIPRDLNSLADALSKAELKKAGVTLKIQPERKT